MRFTNFTLRLLISCLFLNFLALGNVEGNRLPTNPYRFQKHPEIFESITCAQEYQYPQDSSYLRTHVNKAHALYDKVRKEGRIIEFLDFSKVQDLPVGINKSIGGMDYMIIIDSMYLTPNGAFLSAYMSLEIPQSSKRIAFRAEQIKINKNGIDANARLDLVEDFPIRLGEKMMITLKSSQRRTFVRFDCGGFRDISIQGELEFSRDLIVPEMLDGTIIPEPSRVVSRFETVQIQEWGEIIVKLDLPNFQIKGLNGFGFQVSEATLDLSEFANIPNIIFPKKYFSTTAQLPNSPLWKGIYIRNLRVSLPRQFQSVDKERTSFFANHLIIDETGLSGEIGTANLLAINKGNMDGWAFSIDSLNINIAMNQLVGANFTGLIEVPVFEKEPLAYRANINIGGNYLFNVNTTGEKSINFWSAKAKILPGSGLEIRVADTKFLPKISLNGILSVSTQDNDASLADLHFQQLQFQTVAPYIQVAALTLGSESFQQRMSGFPITLEKVGIVSREGNVGLNLAATLNFVGEGDGGFGAKGDFTIWAQQKIVEGKQKLFYKNLEINDVRIDIDGGAFKLKGLLTVYRQHPVYGKGFKGGVKATFAPGLEVQATAQFGNVSDFRYWYADALLSIPRGIVVAPGFGLYGFGGGAYYHMRQKLNKPVNLPENNTNAPSVDAKDATRSVSGIEYVPDRGTFLGIKAKVIIGTHPSAEPFNGDANFEVAFNNNSGIDYIAFEGNAYFMSPIGKNDANAPVYANLKMNYDVPNKSLFADLAVYINVAGGAIRGIGNNNKAGNATLFFSPKDWFIHIGAPDQRIGLKLISIFEASSYFMVGTVIPPMPTPPANVASILGGNLNFMRDENALKSGGGFAFGANIAMNFGDMSFLIFYAKLNAGAGFDIMLKNYGEGVRCAGRSEPLGIDGWYASGQVYGFVQGKIGIRVDLSFVKGNFDIINLGAAVLLQAKLPNPLWMKGTVGGYYSILGGLVSGQCKFQMTIGEQCQIVGGSALSGIKIIAETSPASEDEEISVFNSPQATFNLPIQKIFELVDMDDQRKSFRASLDYFKVSSSSGEIQGKLKWNATKDVVAFEPQEILPPKQKINVKVLVHFEELIAGSWQPLKVNNKVLEELIESSFTTGEAPDYIPASNVLLSYPCNNQMNFYKSQQTQAYIQLKTGQEYLFNSSSEWKYQASLETTSGTTRIPIKYQVNERKIYFEIPNSMENDKIYQFRLIKIPTKANEKIDANVKTVIDNRSTDKDNTINVTTKDIEGSLTLYREKELYRYQFKTSKFSTFNAKLNSINISKGWIWDIMTGVNELGVNLFSSEYFDKYEIEGGEHHKPLLQFEAILDNRWYTQEIFPLIYKDYPLASNIQVTWRKTEELGLPPTRAIYLRQNPSDRILAEQDLSIGSIPEIANYAAFIYNLSYVTYRDFDDLRQKAAISSLRGTNQNLNNLINAHYPILSSGRYKFKLKYVLPGMEQPIFEKEITIHKP